MEVSDLKSATMLLIRYCKSHSKFVRDFKQDILHTCTRLYYQISTTYVNSGSLPNADQMIEECLVNAEHL